MLKISVLVNGPPVVITVDSSSPRMDTAIIDDVGFRFESLARVGHVRHRKQLRGLGSTPVAQLERASLIGDTTATPMAARYRTQSVGLAVTVREHPECFLRKIRSAVLPISLINLEPECSSPSPVVPPESCEGIRATRTFRCKWPIQ